jgi:hypothetical protein
LAETNLYSALKIPERPCTPHSCDPRHEHTCDAEPSIHGPLNQIWPRSGGAR